METSKTIRIGGGAGYWGDSVAGPVQLVQHGNLQYLMLEYLAELTMSILVRARKKDPELGYATDFVQDAMRRTLKDIVAKRIRVVTNAGGVNPSGCARALAKLADELGVQVKIAIVEGDDVMPCIDELREADMRDMWSGETLPQGIASANAYLGAFPVARAFDAGADIVITGRCVDSALVLGPLIHEFGWGETDYDLLAAGSLAGHLIECGTQATGGIHTDWKSVPDWANLGYPIAECRPDGSFVLTKPEGTGGLVNRLTTGEQLVYEIHDPASYLLPDVTVDITQVRLTEIGRDRVLLEGARGKPPTGKVKVSATFSDGWRCTVTRTVVGSEAVAKAERLSMELLAKCERLLAEMGLPPYAETCSEILGSERSSFGPMAQVSEPREVVLRVAVKHQDRRATTLFAREVGPFGTGGPPGISGSGGGRPDSQPILRLFSFLLSREQLHPTVHLLGGEAFEVAFKSDTPFAEPMSSAGIAPEGKPGALPREGRLRDLAVGRSGDKGNTSNICLIARDPEQLPLLWSRVTPEWVRQQLGHLVKGSIDRYALPGSGSMNLVLQDALGGGGMASLRNDPLGKTLAHILLEAPLG
ncbi:acyclic terpene utilization AtuA family protein [Hydrogenophaga sp.]|uniref:acyclic terpene utilization AtuA family protein n=1 Tax=Hydrogenophaga sp. TaxID=1904254 RepID=UPI00271E7045|nr:acyclic terpene utilization AtuA family protein [Hydrogenophaga sp.]MDO9435949.1 acyclic terpene utilization AtuA family protein [Hydrogenophaga sp.]